MCLSLLQVIHRDIKPENILLTASPADSSVLIAKIADFGVSTMCEGDECLISSTAGTGVFMSPEMIKSGARNKGFGGPPTDIWSLGVTLFYLCYGRLPWYSKSLPEIYRMICEDALVFPTGAEFAQVPEAARNLMRGMLEKDPKERVTIRQMFKCPWVTDEGEWDLNQLCANLPPAIQKKLEYKSAPPVAAAICSKDVAAAIVSEVSIKPDAVVPKKTTITIDGFTGQCSTLNKLKTRLLNWKVRLRTGKVAVSVCLSVCFRCSSSPRCLSFSSLSPRLR
jgi:serine/threonine protein kinase